MVGLFPFVDGVVLNVNKIQCYATVKAINLKGLPSKIDVIMS